MIAMLSLPFAMNLWVTGAEGDKIKGKEKAV